MSTSIEEAITIGRELIAELAALGVNLIFNEPSCYRTMENYIVKQELRDDNLREIADYIDSSVNILLDNGAHVKLRFMESAIGLGMTIHKMRDESIVVSRSDAAIRYSRVMLGAGDRILEAISSLDVVDTSPLRESGEVTPELVSCVSNINVLIATRFVYIEVLGTLEMKFIKIFPIQMCEMMMLLLMADPRHDLHSGTLLSAAFH